MRHTRADKDTRFNAQFLRKALYKADMDEIDALVALQQQTGILMSYANFYATLYGRRKPKLDRFVLLCMACGIDADEIRTRAIDTYGIDILEAYGNTADSI